MRTMRAGCREVVGIVLLATALASLSGCGGVANGGSATGAATTSRKTTSGVASVTLHWPARTTAASKLIPVASNSATVAFLDAAGTVLQSQILVRPSGSDSTGPLPTSASFANLPAGVLTVAVSAYSSTDGTGVAVAQGTTTVPIVAGQTVPVNLTLASTIAAVSISPNSLPPTLTAPTLLTATATDASGNIVITSQWQWTSSNTAAFTILQSGSTATLTPGSAGTSTITVTETESGVSASVVAAGTGNGFNGNALSNPQGVAIDPNTQAIYVACFVGALVKFDASGNYVATYGTSGAGKLTSAQGVAVDSAGNVYVGDYGAHDIVKFDSNGNYVTTFNGSSSEVTLGRITGITVDSAGNVYAVDDDASIVYTFSSSGAITSQFSTSIAADGGGQAGTTSIFRDSSGDFWVSDYYYHCFAEYSPAGAFIAQFGTYGTGVSAGLFSQPYGIAIDANNDVYVADYKNDDIQEYSKTGAFKGLFGGPGTDAGEFSGVGGVAVAKNGTIYASDAGGNRLLTFTSIP